MKAYVALGSDSPDYINNLQNRGYEVISVPRFSLLFPPISRHADMILARVGKTVVSNAMYSFDAEELFSALITAGYDLRFDISDNFYEYPAEAKFNILYHGGKIYANKKCISSVVESVANEMNISIVHVNQGYAACNCAVCGKGIITSDPSLHKALTENGVSCLRITEGEIEIDRYRYGFIGGASGYSALDNTLYFCGDITAHPDYDKIEQFASEMGVSLCSLSDGPLFDIGGLVFF